MMKMLTAAVAALALAAPVIAAPPANPFSERLQRLDDARRNAAMRTAILDSGERCKRVTGAQLRGRYKNLHMWVAQCEPQGQVAVFLGPDGSVQVRRCTDMAKLRLPRCG